MLHYIEKERVITDAILNILDQYAFWHRICVYAQATE